MLTALRWEDPTFDLAQTKHTDLRGLVVQEEAEQEMVSLVERVGGRTIACSGSTP